MLRTKHTRGMLRVMIICLASQLGCTIESAPNPYSGPTEATPYTLPIRTAPFRNDGDSINLMDRSAFHDVQLTDAGLMVLTDFSRAGSFVMFKQTGNAWSIISSDHFKSSGPGGDGVNCFDFFDKKNGWLVDYDQHVWTSVNGGENWTRVGNLPGGQTSCEAFQFTTTTRGWYSNGNGGLYKTEDAGKTWRRVSSIRDEGTKVKFINANLGWAVTVDDENNSTIYTTTNGGSSWASHSFKGIAIRDFYPITSEYGITSVRRLLYETSDAGSQIHERPGLPQNFALESQYCSDSAVWWVAGYNSTAGKSTNPHEGSAQLYKTTDGGNSWLAVPVKTTEPFFSKIKFFDEKLGVLVAQNSLYQTRDGGQSWIEILRVPPNDH